jgi:hypothetical protein
MVRPPPTNAAIRRVVRETRLTEGEGDDVLLDEDTRLVGHARPPARVSR